MIVMFFHFRILLKYTKFCDGCKDEVHFLNHVPKILVPTEEFMFYSSILKDK